MSFKWKCVFSIDKWPSFNRLNHICLMKSNYPKKLFMFVRLFRATRHRIIPRRRSIPVRIPQRIDCLATVRIGNRFETDNSRFVFQLFPNYQLSTTEGLFFYSFKNMICRQLQVCFSTVSTLSSCTERLVNLAPALVS